jgi:uncharacterized protein YdhG (YjbR/CyaY superfamily)
VRVEHLTTASAACKTTKTSEYLHLHPHVHAIKHYADKVTERGYGRNREKKRRGGWQARLIAASETELAIKWLLEPKANAGRRIPDAK